MQYTFGDIVIVEGNLIGVVLKCWIERQGVDDVFPLYEVYVRSDSRIETYHESEVRRYLVRHKELSKEELEYQSNAEQD